jgi:primosomal protein N' (replication factor Y)
MVSDCPKCHQTELSHYGAGTQRIMELAQKLWPKHPSIRIDTDNMNTLDAAHTLANLNESRATLIIGTQMITKGHDIDRLNTVVVLNADHGFYATDFRAEEKLFAQLIQVAGRSGRRQTKGHVYIQTQLPNHKMFAHITQPKEYYDYLLEQRQSFCLPPYTYLACIFIHSIPKHMNNISSLSLPTCTNTTILGPMPFNLGKRKNKLCYKIMLTSNCRIQRGQSFYHIMHFLHKNAPTGTQLVGQIDSHLSP